MEPLPQGVRVGEGPRREALQRPAEVALDAAGDAEGQEHLPGRDGVHRHARAGPVADRDRVRRVDLVDVVDEAPSGTDRPAASPASAASSSSVGRATADERSGRRRARPRASRAAARAGSACRRDLLDRALAAERRRAAGRPWISGSPARSATSVTPSGPSASAPSTAKARSMDWTLDIDAPRRLDSRLAVPSYGTVPHRGTPEADRPATTAGATPMTDDYQDIDLARPVRRRARRADAQRPLRRHGGRRSSRGRTSCSGRGWSPRPRSSTTRSSRA